MMNMKKMLALLLAVVMVVGMIPFGAMAEETVTHIETCLEGCALEDCACTCHAAPETPTEEPKQEQPPVAPASLDDTQTQETPVCTCTPVEGVHAEACALYVKPEEPVEEPKTEETPVCTCTPVEGVHAEGCALYEKPQKPVEEVAPVDYAALYESIMNCEDLFAADALVDALNDEQLAAFEESLTEEQSTALDAHYAALIAAYEAEVPTEPVPEEEAAEEDTREILYITKDMTNAAPFGAPVEGPAKRKLLRFAAPAAEDENGLILDKEVSSPDKNGVYTITLEAYATGEKTTIKQELNVPTDIVLVLDQSMSMRDKFSGNLEALYGKQDDLYVKLSDDAYAPVNVARTVVSREEKYTSYSKMSNNEYYNNRNNLYHQHDDGTYGKITVSYSYESYRLVYTYSCSNCSFNRTSDDGYNTVPEFANNFYQLSTKDIYQYVFRYEKANGEVVTATVPDGDSAPNWDFYEYATSSTTTRLEALKEAVRIFADSVAEKAQGADPVDTDDDVNHRIAVIGFGQKGNSGYGQSYTDTELFVGSTQYGYTSADDHYDEAFQDMNESHGVNNVNASINALSANGYTYINLGMELANGVLDANPVRSGEKRNRVIVVFTDGVPGGYTSWTTDSDETAEAAVEEAQTAKNAGVTVYTVGIFDGADASSPGAENGNDAQRANRFMQHLSSNNGTPQTPSYYLSASDSGALNAIFKTISQNIESGGSSVTLNSSTVVKDIIANSFKLPNNADTGAIKVYTDGVDSTTGKFNGEPQTFNATVTIDGKDISVTNFDFSENWVGTETDASGNVTWRGQKLIIKIPIVPETNFLGGNNVPTNGSASGVYSDGELVENFPGPDTDVELKILEIGLATTDQNIYLSNDADLAALVTSLDQRINGTNNAYVNIKYEIKDGETVVGTVEIPAGNTLPATITWNEANGQDMNPALVEDKTYTIVATATPTSGDTAKASTNTKPASVNVFKPVITWQDSQINAGETPVYKAETDVTTDNFVSVVWKHGVTLSTQTDAAGKSIMSGTEPVLSYTFDPAAQPMSVDTPVDVTVLVGTGEVTTDITSYVTFVHEDCNFNGCKWEEAKNAGKEFIVHIKSFDLIVVKDVVDGDAIDQSFLFHVTCPDGSKIQIAINGEGQVKIPNLPTGNYTVEEDTSWSWRYDVVGDASQTVTPDKISNGVATVTFKNDRTNDKWLDGSAYAENIFADVQSTTN